MNKKLALILSSLLSITLISVFGFALFNYSSNVAEPEKEILEEVAEVQPEIQPASERYPFVMPPRSTLSSELIKMGFTYPEISKIVAAAKPFKNLARMNPGTRFAVQQDESSKLTGVRFRFSPKDVLQLNLVGEEWQAEMIEKPVQTQVVTYIGTVTSNLWDSAAEAQMSPALISEMAEIFAWQVDFSREVQVGDKWRISIEEEVIHGEKVGLGTILSAEYVNMGRIHSAVLYRKNGEKLGYYAPDGSSLRKMFLKSPIQFGRISSKFNRNRFHPILKTSRPHLGVDYAAPIGTPIRAVGDGVISFAGWSGGGGNVLKLRHNATYDTAYKHLKGFAPGIKKGTRVRQGQVIGYVGNTGLSTGPHLHFEFYVNGRYVDPLRQKFPSAEAIPQESLAEFLDSQKELMSRLPAWVSLNDSETEKFVK